MWSSASVLPLLVICLLWASAAGVGFSTSDQSYYVVHRPHLTKRVIILPEPRKTEAAACQTDPLPICPIEEMLTPRRSWPEYFGWKADPTDTISISCPNHKKQDEATLFWAQMGRYLDGRETVTPPMDEVYHHMRHLDYDTGIDAAMFVNMFWFCASCEKVMMVLWKPDHLHTWATHVELFMHFASGVLPGRRVKLHAWTMCSVGSDRREASCIAS
ncbi:hypothetical protein DFP72DRAFT_854580 [Ephemerocybe angulata]|uniref:Uncharacterized protein n=1 Tax=Ephemerocybe angulata TaxID=980116 RepID=A0A8H6HHU0_9AGAR|nr:hypothetical protein DFP72DRAFT_854580 [Tulosesus angulatus]